jgi:hypothetical protein
MGSIFRFTLAACLGLYISKASLSPFTAELRMLLTGCAEEKISRPGSVVYRISQAAVGQELSKTQQIRYLAIK